MSNSRPRSDCEGTDGGSTGQAARRPPAPLGSKRRDLIALAASFAVVGYAAAVLAYSLLLRLTSDRWSVGTLLMYGPQWPLLVVSVALLPACLIRRRLFWIAVPTTLFIAGPLMRFELPWADPHARSPEALPLRVMTCNGDQMRLDGEQLDRLLQESKPDIVLMQGYTSRRGKLAFAIGQWHQCRDEELLVASRFPIVYQQMVPHDAFRARNGWAAHVVVSAPQGHVSVINVHFATPRAGLMEVLGHPVQGLARLAELTELRRRQFDAIREEIARSPYPVVIAGDFNSTADSTFFGTYLGNCRNAFTVAGTGYGYTHYTGHTRLRIDHILTGPGWKTTDSWVGPPVGSAHRPVLADLVWTPERGAE